ncbi:MAG: methyltransferase domain-containing protein [Victivallales bacterium]|nr:methyltransferase domain-containing protein [Victivallales bacterium]
MRTKILKIISNNILSRIGITKNAFYSDLYQSHNKKRLEHLASLGLDIAGRTVLEVGAGIGDHTNFFLEKGCEIVSSDAREENIKVLASRYPEIKVLLLNLDEPPMNYEELFDIVYCYGLLYHLSRPAEAIDFMAKCTKKFLLLETCVSFGNDVSVNLCRENRLDPTQALSGSGCRPTRKWVYKQLKKHFEFVYLPITQPNHEEFPTDWTSFQTKNGLSRSIFIGSRELLKNSLLTETIPLKQTRI